MANLVELYDLVIQAQALNGVPLSHGHVYVYALGRTKLMDTWSDIDGESLNPNPVILDNAGQAHIYVSDDFDYTLVFTDEFDNEIFSVDKYLLSKGEHSHADVAVAPSEHIGVSSYHVGEVTVYVPYLTGEVGKVYEGIDPIVVNNDVNRISANHIPLGVQDPLYFVEDSETACIIGCSAQTEIPAELSGKWDEASDAVIANSAQWAEGTEYEAGSYIDIDGHTISVTGLQPEGDYAYNSALSSKLDVTATGQFLTGLPDDLVYSADITGLATTAQLDEKLDKSDSGNFYPMEGNPSGFLTAHQSLQGYATEQWVEDKGYLTAVDIPESATWNATTETVSSNSAQWGASNPQIPVTGINGIKISESADQVVFEVSGDYATNEDVESATSGKADTSATIPVVSSLHKFVTATDYIGAVADTDGNFYQIVTRSGNPESAWVIKYTKDSIFRKIYSENIISTWTGSWTINPYSLSMVDFSVSEGYFNVSGVITANTAGLAATGLSAGKTGPLWIQGQTEIISAYGQDGFTFSSQNTGFGSAQLTTAYGNTIVQMNSPKFEARNSAGAGFSIEASGAKGYDHNGNVTWDTTVTPAPDRLISFAATQPAILISPTPSSYSANAPYLTANYQELAIKVSNGPSAIMNLNGFSIKNGNNQASIGAQGIAVTGSDINLYVSETSASYTLRNSIQQSMIEGDTATSAITAIAGSAIGGGGGGVPQSAFDELKQSYDALSALFAQYSGQWLLPNEGEE